MNIKQGMKISAIIDKMGLEIVNAKGSKEDVGADLMMQLVTKAHKAEKEIYLFVADIKKITVLEAEDVDLKEFIKEMAEVNGLKNFFPSVNK